MIDSRDLRGLDAYITNSRFSRRTTDEECEKCGYRWEARVEGEYGRSYFVDDDGFCPECATQVPD